MKEIQQFTNYNPKKYYYFDQKTGIVYTERYLIEQGECCGNKCKHCPYDPKSKQGNTVIKNEFQYLKKIKND